MGLKEIVARILSVREDLTQQGVLRMIKEKKASAESFFTDEAAARMVASDLEVEITTESRQPRMGIGCLISGLSDVTVTGRIIIVYPLRTFTRSDGREGRVAHLLMADRTGTLRVVLWDEKANRLEKEEIKKGQIVKFSHGYIRKGIDGELELHIGTQGEIEVFPPDSDEDSFPPLADFLKKIVEITTEDKKTNTVGIVRRLHPVSCFKRQNGTEGKVRRLELEDRTGHITVVLWNQKVDELADLKRGDFLQIMGATVKEGLDGQVEAHTGNRTQIEILNEKPAQLEGFTAPSNQHKKIADIEEEEEPVDVEGIIETAPTVREVTTSRGEKVMVASLQLRDETGEIRVSLWRKLVEVVKNLEAGSRIRIRNAYFRKGLSNRLELTSHSLTSLEILDRKRSD